MSVSRSSVAALLAALAGCHAAHSSLAPAGVQASRIHHVWTVYLAVSVVVFVAVMTALTLAVVLRPRDRDAATPPGADPEADARAGRIVGVALALTTLTLFALLFESVRTGHAIASLRAREPMTVRVIAHQWWWEVHYTDGAPSHEVVTANEIHIPVGVPVTFDLRSRDVIHSFWVPALHGKRDAIPGHPTRIVIEADRAGVYRGQCAEFCGLQHANMALRVVAEAPATYRAWLAAQNAPATPPASPSAVRGRVVFLARTCAMCHAVHGTDARAINGPDLTHLASRRTLAAGVIPNTRAALARWIVTPQSIKPGTQMPPNAFAPGELEDLVNYLEGLR